MANPDVERWSPFKAWLYSVFNQNPNSNLEVIDRAALTSDDTFLDVGCGPGAALAHAAATGARVAGIDPTPSMVERAARRVPEADVRVASVEEIPFPDSHFTVVVNVASFHHWADRDAGLREILRVLAPGGRLLIMEAMIKEAKEGHGLNPSEVDLLTARLLEVGFADTSVATVHADWRHKYYIVTATAST